MASDSSQYYPNPNFPEQNPDALKFVSAEQSQTPSGEDFQQLYSLPDQQGDGVNHSLHVSTPIINNGEQPQQQDYDPNWLQHALQLENVCENEFVRQKLRPKIEVLAGAQIGKSLAKKKANDFQKEHLEGLKKSLAKLKNHITAYLLQRQSLCTRVFNNRTGRLAFAKFVIQDYRYKTPNIEEICKTFDIYLRTTDPVIRIIVKHFVNMHSAIGFGVREYLGNHTEYVKRMDRIRASTSRNRGADNTASIAQALSLRRIVHRIMLDMFCADYLDFKFDVIIDEDDLTNHYDYQSINDADYLQQVQGEAVNQNDNLAKQHLEDVLSVVGRNGGNTELMRLKILDSSHADQWSEESFVRHLLKVDQSVLNGENRDNPVEIKTENDVTSIIDFYACKPENFSPTNIPSIVNARLSNQWAAMIHKANSNDAQAPMAQALMKHIIPPLGLLTHQQAIENLSEILMNNKKFVTEAVESGITENVVDFAKSITYLELMLEKKRMEENGESGGDAYKNVVIQIGEQFPDHVVNSLNSCIQQIVTTRGEFEKMGSADKAYANISVTRPGSAVNCFPDYCEDSEGMDQITATISDYLDMKEQFDRTMSASKLHSSLARSSIDDITRRVQEMIGGGPSPDEVLDTNYFIKNYDAAWIDPIEGAGKLFLQKLSMEKAKLLDAQAAQKVEETMSEIMARFNPSPEDLDLFRKATEMAVQPPPEEYVIRYKDTTGSMGSTTATEVEYYSPEVQNRIKAAKTNFKTSVGWDKISSVLFQVVSEYADSCVEEKGYWAQDAVLNDGDTLRGLLDLLQPDVLQLFLQKLLITLKTASVAEAEDDSAGSNKKKRKRITESLVKTDEAASTIPSEQFGGISEEELSHLRTSAEKGKLTLKTGAATKKRITVFTNGK